MKHELLKQLKKQGNNLPPGSKKALLIGGAIVGVLGMLVIVAVTVVGVMLFNSIGTEDISRTAQEVKGISQRINGDFNVQDYLQNGTIDTESLQQQINSFTPQEATKLQKRVNELLQNGEITPQQAEDVRSILETATRS